MPRKWSITFMPSSATGQRSQDNDGSNANFGFIVTAQGVILIDSGASKRGAEKIAAAIAQVTDQPGAW